MAFIESPFLKTIECIGSLDSGLFSFLSDNMNTFQGPEFDEWSDWSACSATCGEGEMTRSRSCTFGCSNIDENDPDHSLIQTQVCNLSACSKFTVNWKYFSKNVLDITWRQSPRTRTLEHLTLIRGFLGLSPSVILGKKIHNHHWWRHRWD